VFVDPLSAVLPEVAPAGAVPAGAVPAGAVPAGAVLGPPEDGGLDVGEADVEELLAGAGEDAVALGLAVLDGSAEYVEHCVPVASADVLLTFVFGEAEVAVLAAVELALAVPVAVVAVAAPVAVPVAVVPPAGLLLALPPGGLLTEFSGDALGTAGLTGAAVAEAEGELVAHPVTGAPPWTAEVPS
jgi:hypothetical protein